MKNNIFWLLGSDDNHGWHQRIMLAPSIEEAQKWWKSVLGRDAEVALDFDMIEQSVKTLDAALDEDTLGLFAGWVLHGEMLSFVPVLASTEGNARQQIQELIPEGHIQAIVTPAPLVEVYARILSILNGETAPDENIL